MPRFMATHSVPFTEEVLTKYAREEAPKFGRAGVTWIRTFVIFPARGIFANGLHPTGKRSRRSSKT